MTTAARSPFVLKVPLKPKGTGGHKPVEGFIQALKGLRKKVKGPNRSGQYSAQCPAHQDRSASLSIAAGKDGQVLLKCHAGCEPAAIVEGAGLKWSDLWPGHGHEGNGKPKDEEVSRTPLRQVAEYHYRGEDGEPLYRVARLECTVTMRRPDGTTYKRKDKTFRQSRPVPDGWVDNIEGVRRVPYMLPELLSAPAGAVIYLVEGEQCVHALTELGLVATTASGGALSWDKADQPTIRKALGGRPVVILPDNDPNGQQYGASALRDLIPVAASVKVINLPGLPVKGDVVDWLADDHTVAELEALVAETKPETTAPPESGPEQHTAD